MTSYSNDSVEIDLNVTGKVVINLEAATPQWLTEVLARSGALECGAVESIDARISERDLSVNARLSVSYAPGSGGELPERLLLKIVNGQVKAGSFGPSEVHYYVRDYVDLRDGPLVRSYDAAYSKDLQRYHVLVEDLSETHTNGFSKAPTLGHGLALAEGLAKLHAHWWGPDRLQAGGEPIPGPDSITRFVEMSKPGLRHILEYPDNQLKSHWPDALIELFEEHPRAMIDRTQLGVGFTLIHCDVNPGNILVPRGEVDRPIYIIDRQPFDWSITTWLGVYDLSYAIVHWWEVETRREYQDQILERYHQHLVKQGVDDYSFDQLLTDYRLSAVMSVYVATEWFRDGVREESVQLGRSMLQKAMTAYDDLECRALWAH